MTLVAGGLTQFREVNGHGGGELFSQGNGPLHFGLGAFSIIDSITIEWPSGDIKVLSNISPNQVLTIVE